MFGSNLFYLLYFQLNIHKIIAVDQVAIKRVAVLELNQHGLIFCRLENRERKHCLNNTKILLPGLEN